MNQALDYKYFSDSSSYSVHDDPMIDAHVTHTCDVTIDQITLTFSDDHVIRCAVPRLAAVSCVCTDYMYNIFRADGQTSGRAVRKVPITARGLLSLLDAPSRDSRANDTRGVVIQRIKFALAWIGRRQHIPIEVVHIVIVTYCELMLDEQTLHSRW